MKSATARASDVGRWTGPSGGVPVVEQILKIVHLLVQIAIGLGTFFPWYNHEHRHSALALYTPADVHYGRVEQIRQTRQAALDAAYQRHPDRFVQKPPEAAAPPQAVWINPPENAQMQPVN